MPKDASIGVDPWCISIDTAQRWERAFTVKQQKLVQTIKNLVDEVWTNRPPAKTNAVNVHPLEFAGRSIADKLKFLREKLVLEKARGIIFTALDEVSILSTFHFVYFPYFVLNLSSVFFSSHVLRLFSTIIWTF